MPAAEVSDPVKTVAAGFRAGERGLAYTVLYDLQEPFDSDLKAVATFQNPAGGKPLTAERLVPAGERRIALKSPLIFTIRNHKNYDVTLTLYRDGRAVAVQRDKARFDVDGAVVPMFIKRGITVR